VLETLQVNLQTNTVGTLAVSLAFLPLLRKGAGKKIWNVSTAGAQMVGGISHLPFAATCEPAPAPCLRASPSADPFECY
jgi:NAD(P)-dependent dehydrogenase (short-subunit alcohol dehydrogenase family)